MPAELTKYRHMARDEMHEITSDRWDEDIWGAAVPGPGAPRPKLVFYFGTIDKWVADRTRDDLIAARGCNKMGEEWKAKMMIDDLGIPHSFCICELKLEVLGETRVLIWVGHSSVVAEKTAAWIKEMVGNN